MVIEADEATHDFSTAADAERDAYMQALGLKVVRVAAVDVLANSDGVADAVYRLCDAEAGPSTAQPGG